MTHVYIPMWEFLLMAIAVFVFGAFLGRISK
jgi:hypothetical protein